MEKRLSWIFNVFDRHTLHSNVNFTFSFKSECKSAPESQFSAVVVVYAKPFFLLELDSKRQFSVLQSLRKEFAQLTSNEITPERIWRCYLSSLYTSLLLENYMCLSLSCPTWLPIPYIFITFSCESYSWPYRSISAISFLQVSLTHSVTVQRHLELDISQPAEHTNWVSAPAWDISSSNSSIRILNKKQKHFLKWREKSTTQHEKREREWSAAEISITLFFSFIVWRDALMSHAARFGSVSSILPHLT